MTSLALALSIFSYQFPLDRDLRYNVKIGFEGYLPALGGIDGKVEAEMGMTVRGMAPDADGARQAVSDLTSLLVRLDGEKLPFNVDSIRPFFPKNTISHSPQGKILKTDAPDRQLPARLPGLDVKRFPDITYLLVEFPTEGYEIGKPFTYEKPFGDSKVVYQVTPQKLDGNTLNLSITLKQSYETLEDEAKNLVTEAKDAAFKVKTEVAGTGEAQFDVQRGILLKSKIDGESTSVATPVAGGESTTRKLKQSLRVEIVP